MMNNTSAINNLFSLMCFFNKKKQVILGRTADI